MRSLGVDWGYHPGEDLLSAGAELVARQPGDILEHLLQ
jgi:phosphoglycolate phosphatase-like HAD superfamily hydrolase